MIRDIALFIFVLPFLGMLAVGFWLFFSTIPWYISISCIIWFIALFIVIGTSEYD